MLWVGLFNSEEGKQEKERHTKLLEVERDKGTSGDGEMRERKDADNGSEGLEKTSHSQTNQQTNATWNFFQSSASPLQQLLCIELS